MIKLYYILVNERMEKMAVSFKGGRHVKDNKLTASLEAKPIMPCKEHIYPMIQHIGVPVSPIVAVGDMVKVGQKIADSDAFMSSPIHASVSGKVTAIKKHEHPSGAMVEAIFIENDNFYTPIDNPRKIEDYKSLSPDELRSIIREAGIVGMGGAGFPTHIKLAPKTPIKYLIINAAECEPFITSDHRRMMENSEDIIDGIHILMYILGVKNAYIGIENNKRECIDSMRKAARYDESINIIAMKTKYPQGAEKVLVKTIAGRSIPIGKLPADVGCVVINLDTVYNISRSIRTGIPMTERIVTVTGDAINEPDNFIVPFGVPFSHLINEAKGFKEEPKKVIAGGPMTGSSQYNLEAPTVKTTSAIVSFVHPPHVYDADSPCIRCGRCVQNCPMQLMPNHLSDAALKKDVDKALKYNILDCMQCGVCSYVCPARKNLLANIKNIRPAALSAYRKEQENGK